MQKEVADWHLVSAVEVTVGRTPCRALASNGRRWNQWDACSAEGSGCCTAVVFGNEEACRGMDGSRPAWSVNSLTGRAVHRVRPRSEGVSQRWILHDGMMDQNHALNFFSVGTNRGGSGMSLDSD